jgi:hypothetical protein
MQEPLTDSASAGFYTGIISGNVDRGTTSDVAASAAYSLIRGAFVQIPELPQGAGLLVLIVGVCIAVIVLRKKRIDLSPE